MNGMIYADTESNTNISIVFMKDPHGYTLWVMKAVISIWTVGVAAAATNLSALL